MPRKSTGRPRGRPVKPFIEYPQWATKLIRNFAEAGDLTPKFSEEMNQRNAQSAAATFNRARSAYVHEALVRGNTPGIAPAEAGYALDRADIASDIIARVTCNLDGVWGLEFEMRGKAVESALRVSAHLKALKVVPVDDTARRWEEQLEQGTWRVGMSPDEVLPKPRQLTEAELAEEAIEREKIAQRREAERLMTERWKKEAEDAKIESDIDKALNPEKPDATNHNP